MRNAGLDEAQTGIKIAERNINNLRYAENTTLMAESEVLKSLSVKVKEGSEKVGLKLNIRSWHLVPSIHGRQMGKQWLTIFLDSKITADGDCSNGILKKCLLLGGKVMTNLDNILKSRDITLSAKVHPIKAMVFPVVMYGCQSWTIKKAGCWRIDVFELWCWRRLLRVPWTARRSNQSILKEISPGCWLEGLMLKLKLQYFGHLMRRADSLEKTLMLEKIKDRRKRGQQRMRWLDGITDSMDMVWVDSGSWWWTGRPACCNSWGHKELDTNEWLNWTYSHLRAYFSSVGPPLTCACSWSRKENVFYATSYSVLTQLTDTPQYSIKWSISEPEHGRYQTRGTYPHSSHLCPNKHCWNSDREYHNTLNSPRPCLSYLQAWANYTPKLTPSQA